MEQVERRDFFNWWVRELRAIFGMVPTPYRRALTKALIVRVDHDRFELARLIKGNITILARFPVLAGRGAHSDDSQLRAILRANRLPVVLRVGPDLGVLVTETLPLAHDRDFEGIIRHRVDLLSPWSHQQAYFDYEILDVDASNLAKVRIAIAPKRIIDELTSRLANLGLSVDGADIEADGRHWSEPTYDVTRGGVFKKSQPTMLLPVLATCALLAVILAYNGSLYLSALTELRERTVFRDALATRVADLPEIEDALDQLRQHASFIVSEKAQQSSSAVIIEMLSRIMPQNSWIDEISLSGNDVEIVGFAFEPATVPVLLEASRHFTDVAFQLSSDVTDADVDGSGEHRFERFTISAKAIPHWRLAN